MSEQIHLSADIPDELAGLRLDQALAKLFPDYSRGQLSKWIKAGQVQLADRQPRPRDAVRAGEKVVVAAELENIDESWRAEPIALDIVYEDDAVLIINKPAGLVVHPGAGNPHGTLVNALLAHAPALIHIPRAGVVHRLDKDTSGLLMIAKTLPAHHSLVSQLQNRSVKREYQAVINGVITGGGKVDQPLGRHPVDRKKMAVVKTGKPAVTHYRLVQRFRGHTHVRCQLETGRTHQIRVHMAYLRHPLVGDPVYGGLRFGKGLTESARTVLSGFRRQALHAGLLGFEHPESGEEMRFEAPMPDDMQQLIAILQEDAESSE